MAGKKFIAILVIVFALVLLLVIMTDLFNIWSFAGMIFLGFTYMFGYFYVINYYLSMQEEENDANANKKKFDWCWNRVNEMLRKMPGGQGLEWRKGIGRQSEFRTYYDGIVHRPFRSLSGYLAETQQLVIIIYDIDADDIVRFYADPEPELINNHFFNFKPYQQKMGISPTLDGRRSGYSYPSRYRNNRGVSIHVGNDDFEEFDSLPRNLKPDDKVVDDAMNKLRKDNGGR